MKVCYHFWRIFFVYFVMLNIQDIQAQIPLETILPPTHVRGHQVENQFTSQTDIVNVIKWGAPSGGLNPVSYRIYRDADLTELAATIPATKKLKFRDHNRKKNHTYSYYLVSVDAAGQQSSPVIIVFRGNKVHVKQQQDLLTIEVTPINPQLAVGFSIQFTATGIYPDGTKQDLTNQVTWSSSHPSIATISNELGSKGLATGRQAGKTTIHASLAGVRGSTTLTVSDAQLVAISLIPINPTVAASFQVQFTAIGLFSDNTTEDLTNTVTWTTSNPTIAIISNEPGSKGLATGIGAGTTTIQASINGITDSTTLTVTAATLVSIGITPVDPTLAQGFTSPFIATGLFSDNTTEDLTNEVIWASSVPSVASISNDVGSKGVATALSPGFTTISASVGGITGTTILTVTEATLVSIVLIPNDNPTLPAGFNLQFIAIGTFSDGTTEDLTAEVAWESSNTTVAQISSAGGSAGLATALSPGSTIITATIQGVSGSTTLSVTAAELLTITVEPANPSIAAGFLAQFTAIGLFSDGTTEDITNEVTWASSNETVAEISNGTNTKGRTVALVPGTTVISATSLNGLTGNTTLTVTNAVLISIAVTPANPTIPAGVPTQFIATGTFSDGSTENITTQVTWQSSDTAIAEISNATGSQGIATGKAVGTTTITATLNAVTGNTTLTVNCDAITITTDSDLPNAIPGNAYNIELITSGGVEPVTFAIISGTLPPGLNLSADGVISGAPTVYSGIIDYNFTVQATSACGSVTTKPFTITLICTLPNFTSPPNNTFPEGTFNQPYNYQIVATGATPITYSYDPSFGPIPNGLSVTADGLLTGTPSQAGTFNFRIQANNGCGSANEVFTIVISLNI